MATYLARPCPRCNGYLSIVLREPGRNMPVRAVNGALPKMRLSTGLDRHQREARWVNLPV
jgi:hypothetical protein